MIHSHPNHINGNANSQISIESYMINHNMNHEKALQVLMLEDNENDAELLGMYLKSSPLNVKSTLVSNKQDYINALKNNEFDVILSDHNLPQFSSLEALRIRNETKFHIPFILVSGTIPEEYAVTILQEGANDYILKDRPQRLVTAITEAIKKQKALSDKLLAEQELIQINERLKLVGKATADAIWDWNILTNEVFRGEGFKNLFGYTFNDNKTDLNFWTENIHPDDIERVKAGINNFLKSKRTNWQDEFRYIKADGTCAMVLDKGIVLRDKNGNPYRMVGATQDITHVRQLEMKIQEQKLNHQKQNTEIVILAQEEERKNIGKELHDNINQLMAFAKMMLDTARNSPEIRDVCVNKSYEGINMAIEEVRKLSHTLVPPTFSDAKHFIDAVNDLVANIHLAGKINIAVDMAANLRDKLTDKKIKLTFYRIIQEQINNILKYSKATCATIALQITHNKYRLIISDNGIGINLGKKQNGIGLRNIESRVEVHSGTMKIISAPGEGCTLKIEIPFKDI